MQNLGKHFFLCERKTFLWYFSHFSHISSQRKTVQFMPLFTNNFDQFWQFLQNRETWKIIAKHGFENWEHNVSILRFDSSEIFWCLYAENRSYIMNPPLCPSYAMIRLVLLGSEAIYITRVGQRYRMPTKFYCWGLIAH